MGLLWVCSATLGEGGGRGGPQVLAPTWHQEGLLQRQAAQQPLCWPRQVQCQHYVVQTQVECGVPFQWHPVAHCLLLVAACPQPLQPQAVAPTLLPCVCMCVEWHPVLRCCCWSPPALNHLKRWWLHPPC